MSSARGDPTPDGPQDVEPRGRPSANLGGLLRTTAIVFGVAVLGFVVGFAVAVGLLNVLVLGGVLSTEPSAIGVAIVSLVALQGIGFPLVALGYLRWRGLPFSFLRARLPSLRDLGVAVLGVVAILGLVVVSQLVITQLGLTPASRNDTDVLTQPDFAVIGIPLMLLLVGPGEELLFRGVIQTSIREVSSAPVAIVLASLAFAPAHILAFVGTGADATAVLLSLSLLFLPSLVFGTIYEYTNNLVVPALSHGLWNSLLLATVLLGPQTVELVSLGPV